MSLVERHIEIARPPGEVYELLMDPDRLGDWVSIHRAVKDVSDRPLRKGSTLRQTLHLGGTDFDVAWTVVEADPPGHVRWEGKGPARSVAIAEYDLAESDGGTRFSYANEFKLPGGPLGAVAARVVSGASERETERTLENLKRLLER
jgi:carbon monoxide dehydrogenase subunit G